MQRSRHFTVALQELKNLRPQLYSAAEYFESSYHYSDQKQVVLDNLKDYSVKALVNAVDHLGTVAYKLNDLLAQEDAELATTQTRSDSLTQRLRACQEHSDREGMKQQSLIRTCPRNYSHYVLVDPLAEDKAQNTAEAFSQTFDPEQLLPVQREQTPPVNGSKSLQWHLSSDSTPSTQGGSRVSLASSSGNGRPESSAIARDSFLSLPLGHLLLSVPLEIY
eukprot:TRINITY_DN2493_c0_g1_i3.p1 TRINITY_DN2493_c0_g1~~TRINITY_DN2493_c0_g1_i3.p1  ORF type:complete len:231 (-),score=28.38 TRINITY_DN2493_c0_g1_i3:9-671(-)